MDRNLLALIKVIETGNLTLAAEKIGLAQPSLTKRLKLLESEYRTKLFERRPHGMVPTEFGSVLYEHAKRIQQHHLQAAETIAAKKSGHLDVIRVGAGPVIRSYFMRPLYEALREEFEGIRLEFRNDVHLRNLPFLRNGELDVVFGAIADDKAEDGIETFPIVSSTLGVLAHRNHILFQKKSINAHDLVPVPWIHYSDGGLATKLIEAYYVRHGLSSPKFEVKTTSLEFGLELVSSGRFIMPATVELTEAFKSLEIEALPMEEPIDRFPIGAYVRTSSLQFPVVKRLIELAENLPASKSVPL